MSNRIDRMLEKTERVRSARDIPDKEVVKSSAPKTAPGTLAAWQSAQERIKELESKGSQLTALVAAIAANPWQPRRLFDEAALKKLAAGIAEIGLIQPVTVRKHPEVGSRYTYQLVAGERRLRAHALLGLAEIKVIVVEVSDEDMIALALAENLDREDLCDFEVSRSLRDAESQFPNRKHMAAALGMERSDLYRYLAFNDLPPDVLADLETEPRTLGRAAAAELQSVIKKHGDPARHLVSKLWTRVRSGDLDQGKLAGIIEASILRGGHAPSDRDIRKLFVGKEQAGSITRDSRSLTVRIKATALSPEKEAELRSFVENLFQ